MVQEKVLKTIQSKQLVAYTVWEPIFQTDDERSSRKATTLLPDKRVRHYWVGSQGVGELFQAPLELTSEPAWDVYLVYRPGRAWEGAPPVPDFFMHQLRERLPDDRLLDGAILAEQIRKLIQ